MVLDPSGGFSGNNYAKLKREITSSYAKKIASQRLRGISYSTTTTGKTLGRPPKTAQPYTDNPYLTVQILKNAGSEDITLEQNTFGPFRKALEKESNTKVEEFQKNVTPQLLKIGESRVRARNFNHAQRLYEGVLTDNKPGTEERAANKAFELCSSLLQAAKS